MVVKEADHRIVDAHNAVDILDGIFFRTEDLVKHTWRSSTSSLWEVVYRYDAANELRRLSEQTQILMIHGQNDDIAPFAAVKQLADERPGWTLIALEGFDHHPFLRTPHTCLTHIDSLLSGDQP